MLAGDCGALDYGFMASDDDTSRLAAMYLQAILRC